jgi:glutathione S-transferase
MTQLKLTYFDIDGGRGESVRLALTIGGIEFEDERFPFSEWPAVKERTPLLQVPVLAVDGEVMTQSNTMNRFVGNMAGLYPDDALEAAHCDEVMAAVEDVLGKIVVTFGIKDEEKMRTAREALAAGQITRYLRWLEESLTRHGGNYFAGNRLSVGDLKVFVWVRALRSGHLDHVPTDLVDNVAPKLVEHLERIQAHPGIVDYYQRRSELAH